jgi:hypothetical protein
LDLFLQYKNNSPHLQEGAIYDLNFFALGAFSPLSSRSAPTFLPLPGQPRLREPPNMELIKLQEEAVKLTSTRAMSKFLVFIVND